MDEIKHQNRPEEEYLMWALLFGFYEAKIHKSGSISFIKNGQKCIYTLKQFEEIFLSKNTE